jgi:hypothetical protein
MLEVIDQLKATSNGVEDEEEDVFFSGCILHFILN